MDTYLSGNHNVDKYLIHPMLSFEALSILKMIYPTIDLPPINLMEKVINGSEIIKSNNDQLSNATILINKELDNIIINNDINKFKIFCRERYLQFYDIKNLKNELQHLFVRACEYSSLRIAKYLLNVYNDHIDIFSIKSLEIKKICDTVKFIDWFYRMRHNYSLENEVEIFSTLCAHGDLIIIEYAFNKFSYFDKSKCDIAKVITNGHSHVIEWLYRKIPSIKLNNLFILACNNNQLEIAKLIFLNEKKIIFGPYDLLNLCSSSNPEMLEWLWFIFNDIINIEILFEESCKVGKIENAKLFMKLAGKIIDLKSETLIILFETGSINILAWYWSLSTTKHLFPQHILQSIANYYAQHNEINFFKRLIFLNQKDIELVTAIFSDMCINDNLEMADLILNEIESKIRFSSINFGGNSNALTWLLIIHSDKIEYDFENDVLIIINLINNTTILSILINEYSINVKRLLAYYIEKNNADFVEYIKTEIK